MPVSVFWTWMVIFLTGTRRPSVTTMDLASSGAERACRPAGAAPPTACVSVSPSLYSTSTVAASMPPTEGQPMLNWLMVTGVEKSMGMFITVPGQLREAPAPPTRNRSSKLPATGVSPAWTSAS